MRRNATATAGWSTMTPVMDGRAICAAQCVTNIEWRTLPTEVQVFGIYPSGEAVPVSDRTLFTYR